MAEDEKLKQEEKKNWESSINEEYELRRLQQEEKKEAAEREAKEKERKQLTGKAVGQFFGLSGTDDRRTGGGKQAAESGTAASPEQAEQEDKRMIIWWLPGFRSHTIWKMIVATALYAFLIFYTFSIAQYQIESGVSEWRAILGPVISCIIAPIFAGNPGYFDSYIPVLNRVNIWFRRLLRVTLAFLIFVGGLML